MIGSVLNNEVGSSVRAKLNAATAQLDAISAIKVYRALLTQAGGADPVAVVLENTLGSAVVWTRTGSGVYTGVLAGAFPVDKTFLLATVAIDATVAMVRIDDDSVTVNTFGSGIGLDGRLTSSAVEILVYP